MQSLQSSASSWYVMYEITKILRSAVNECMVWRSCTSSWTRTGFDYSRFLDNLPKNPCQNFICDLKWLNVWRAFNKFPKRCFNKNRNYSGTPAPFFFILLSSVLAIALSRIVSVTYYYYCDMLTWYWSASTWFDRWQLNLFLHVSSYCLEYQWPPMLRDSVVSTS